MSKDKPEATQHDWRQAAKEEFNSLAEWQKPQLIDVKNFAYQHFDSGNTVDDVCFIVGDWINTMPADELKALVSKWYDAWKICPYF